MAEMHCYDLAGFYDFYGCLVRIEKGKRGSYTSYFLTEDKLDYVADGIIRRIALDGLKISREEARALVARGEKRLQISRFLHDRYGHTIRQKTAYLIKSDVDNIYARNVIFIVRQLIDEIERQRFAVEGNRPSERVLWIIGLLFNLLIRQSKPAIDGDLEKLFICWSFKQSRDFLRWAIEGQARQFWKYLLERDVKNLKESNLIKERRRVVIDFFQELSESPTCWSDAIRKRGCWGWLHEELRADEQRKENQ